MSNIWLDLKDENNLYRNLILLKCYSLCNGHINIHCDERTVKNSIQELFEDNFKIDYFRNNIRYLKSSSILELINPLSLTTYGIQHTERLIDELSSLNEKEIEIVKNNNNTKIIKFLEISSKIGTTVSPIINLINILKK